MALTFADKIQIGKVSAYLANVDTIKSSLFGGRLDPRLPLMLQMETDAVEWMYQLNPTDTSLTSTVNYLYELCGGYAAKAASIVASGVGSTITPVSANGYIYTSVVYVVTTTETGSGAPVNNATIWINPLFLNAQQLTFILVDNVVETVGFGFIFDPTQGKITRSNPFFTGSTVVVSFLRKI